MRSTMVMRMLAGGSAILVAACQMPADEGTAPSRAGALRQGIPSYEQMGVEVPGAAASLTRALGDIGAGAGGEGDAEVGERAMGSLAALERASFYKLTRDTSAAVNGGTLALLAVIKALAETEPSEVSDDHRTYGPWTSALEPLAYMFRIEVESDGGIGYKLTAKPKRADDSAWKPILVGDYQPERLYRGSGTVYIDADAVQALDPAGNHGEGKVSIRWSNVTPPRTVEVTFRDFADRQGDAPWSAIYRYSEDEETAGNFQFAVRGDVHGGQDPARTAQELSAISSRWLQSGAGRSDVVITGGDVPSAEIHATECWDQSFHRVFYTDDGGHAPTEGDAAACAL